MRLLMLAIIIGLVGGALDEETNLHKVWCFLIGIAVLFLFIYLIEVFNAIKSKLNKPKVGMKHLSKKLLKRGDRVSIKGHLLRFDHFTIEDGVINPLYPLLDRNKTFAGNLAFENPHGIGYIIRPLSSLECCDFICGKYGLKWVYSNSWINKAEEILQKNY